jgi:hypothetical protein
LLGFKHPGIYDTPTEYSADPTGMMGLGDDMRADYYHRWRVEIAKDYPGTNWVVELKR